MAKKKITIKNYQKYIHVFHCNRRAFAEPLKVTTVPRKQCEYHYSSDLAISWATKGSQFHSWQGQNIFLFSTISTLAVAHPAPYPMVVEVLSPGIKQLVQEAIHSPPSRAEVKNVWLCNPTIPLCLHSVHRCKCTFTVYISGLT
jgi:hypothetical protein